MQLLEYVNRSCTNHGGQVPTVLTFQVESLLLYNHSDVTFETNDEVSQSMRKTFTVALCANNEQNVHEPKSE